MATKYVARIDGQIVGHRTTMNRTYSHAIVVNGHGKTNKVLTWCGRLDLAQGEQRKAQRYGYTAEIVPAEKWIIPSRADAAKAVAEKLIADGRLIFTHIGKDD
jgi:hypothetical protein